MKICVISGIAPSSQNPMAGIFILNRVYEYKKENDVNFIVPKSCLSNNKQNSYIFNNVKITYLSYLKLFHDPNIVNKYFFTKCIKKYIKNNRPDVIVSHNLTLGHYILKLVKRYNIKVIQFYHGSEIHTLALKNKTFRKMAKDLLENVDGNFFVSNDLLLKAKNITNKINNYFISNNGINTEIFRSYSKEDLALINSIINKENKYTFGFIGHFKYIKGFDMIPSIIDELSKLIDISKIKLIIIGKGELKDKVIDNLKNKNIDFSVFDAMKQSELAKYLNCIDTVIMPSRNEGFPCLIREALACGCHILASDVGGIKEAAFSEKSKIISFDNDFIKNFSKAMAFNFNQNKKNISLNEEIIKQFSWQNIARNELKIIKDLLE
ncbi:glycosyltransferase [Caldicellulosiruptoraceae bacterium PP1]